MDDYFIKQEIVFGTVPEPYASEVVVGNDSDTYESDNDETILLEGNNKLKVFLKYSDDNSDELQEYEKIKKSLDESNKEVNSKKRGAANTYVNSPNVKKSKTSSPVKKKESPAAIKNRKFLFECSLCLFKSTSDEELKLHMVDHLDGPDAETFIEESLIGDSYRCFFCPFNTTTKTVFASHLKKSHKDPNSITSIKKGSRSQQDSDYDDSSDDDSECNLDDSFSKEYQSKSKGSKKIFHCSYCSFTSDYKYRLVRHEMIHTGEKPYHCHLCDYSCIQQNALKLHIIKRHGGENFPSTSKNNQESKFTPKGRNVKSPKKYSSAQKAESETIYSKRWKNMDGKFSCSYCPYRSDYRHRVTRHERIHTGDKPFVCPHCNFRCNQSDYLRVHMRMHTGEKPFRCKFCSFATSTGGTLRMHEKRHSAEKQCFSCEICGDIFETRSCMKKHQSKAHPAEGKKAKLSVKAIKKRKAASTTSNTYQCSFCDFKCNTFVELSQHSQQHKSELMGRSQESLSKMRYRCAQCGARFQKKRELKVHSKVHNEPTESKDVTIEVGGYVLKVCDE